MLVDAAFSQILTIPSSTFKDTAPEALTLSPIETPPLTTNDPVGVTPQVDDATVSLLNLTIPSTVKLVATLRSLLNLTLPLNVTGPLNWDRIVLELPPSTSSLSLMITSSNTTLSVLGSSPVTVGIGISNVICSPESDEILVFPI